MLADCPPTTGNRHRNSHCQTSLWQTAADSLEVAHAVTQQLRIIQPALLGCLCRCRGRRASFERLQLLRCKGKLLIAAGIPQSAPQRPLLGSHIIRCIADALCGCRCQDCKRQARCSRWGSSRWMCCQALWPARKLAEVQRKIQACIHGGFHSAWFYTACMQSNTASDAG
jgi:hypothetical protein